MTEARRVSRPRMTTLALPAALAVLGGGCGPEAPSARETTPLLAVIVADLYDLEVRREADRILVWGPLGQGRRVGRLNEAAVVALESDLEVLRQLPPGDACPAGEPDPLGGVYWYFEDTVARGDFDLIVCGPYDDRPALTKSLEFIERYIRPVDACEPSEDFAKLPCD